MKLILLDSISTVSDQDGGAFVVTGSHGGVSAGRFVLSCRSLARFVAFNDAGIGKDEAGVAALQQLEAHGVMAVTYSHWSARIGDAEDAWRHGIISRVNMSAKMHGVVIDMSIQDAHTKCLPKTL